MRTMRARESESCGAEIFSAYVSVAQSQQIRDHILDLLGRQKRLARIGGSDVIEAVDPIISGHHALAIEQCRVHEAQAHLRGGYPVADAGERRPDVAERCFSRVRHCVAQETVAAVTAQYRCLAACRIARLSGKRSIDLPVLYSVGNQR